MAIPAHKTEYFIIENSNLQKKANTADESIARCPYDCQAQSQCNNYFDFVLEKC